MEPEKYSAASLLTMCNDYGTGEVKEVLPWHDLKDDGLWLSKLGRLVVGNDLKTMRWHPRMNGNLPALPIPFSAYELAAFFLAGGGVFLHDKFDDGESLDEDALEDLGDNADDERQVLREAHRLYLEAGIRFGRTDQGTREAADWLLNHAFDESIAVADEQQSSQQACTQALPLAKPDVANTCSAKSRPLTSREIASAFAGIYDYDERQWSNKLSDVNNAAWLRPAMVLRGSRPHPSTWNPVRLAELLQDKGVTAEVLNRLFFSMPTLKPWLTSWQESSRASNGFGR